MTTMKNQRIQRQRTKGWRMPGGVLYVGKPTRWGNPFDSRVYGMPLALDLYRELVSGSWDPNIAKRLSDTEYRAVMDKRRDWIDRFLGDHILAAARYDLSGHDLACWCPLDIACHADILLEIANATA